MPRRIHFLALIAFSSLLATQINGALADEADSVCLQGDRLYYLTVHRPNPLDSRHATLSWVSLREEAKN